MSAFTIVGISGSLRKASTNRGMLRYAQEIGLPRLAIEIADISEIPLYNQDIDAAGRPAAVEELVKKVTQADGLLLATAEYNYCIAPPLKNALDWLSRIPGNPALSGKPAAIMSAGGGMGGSRAQYQLRQMCVYLNVLPLAQPEVFANAFTDQFDTEGNLVSDFVKNLIAEQMKAFAAWIERLKQ